MFATPVRTGTEERFTEWHMGTVEEWVRVSAAHVGAGDIVRIDGAGAYVYGARPGGDHVRWETARGDYRAPIDAVAYVLER